MLFIILIHGGSSTRSGRSPRPARGDLEVWAIKSFGDRDHRVYLHTASDLTGGEGGVA